MTVKLEEVQAKAEKGEELTPEEQKAVMEFDGDGAPPVEGEEEGEGKDGKVEGAPEGKKEEPPKKEEPAPKKAEEKPKENEPAQNPDHKKRLDEELAKPPGEENLKDFSPKEKAYFYEMRTTRRRMQAAEARAKEIEFELLQERIAKKKERDGADGKPKADAGTPAPTVDDFFKGKEDDDVVTVAEIKKALAAVPKGEAKPSGVDKQTKRVLQDLTFQIGLLALKSEGVSDAEEVLRYTDELLDPDVDKSDYAKAAVEAVQEAGASGKVGSYVKVIYNLIKGHPRWDEIESKLSASKAAAAGKTPGKNPIEEEKRRRAERIEENADKARGTGGAGGAGDSPDGEFTDEELAAMTVDDWAKLKPAVRDRALKRLN